MSAMLLSLFAVCSTALGGLCAFRLRHRSHLVLGFTSGALLGVVAFDLVPESLEQARQFGGDGQAPLVALAIGFLVFHTLQHGWSRGHHRHDRDAAGHAHRPAGPLSAAALIVHSFIDGMGIGIAFQASPTVGVMVASAVIAHDFCDGLNTVSLMLANRQTHASALAMLVLDALAPLLGVAATHAIELPPQVLAPLLGFVAGSLLCIGASHIVARVRWRAGVAPAPALMTPALLGAGVIYLMARATQ